jgi:NAD dependent epimerase/dehydratase family enzyme
MAPQLRALDPRGQGEGPITGATGLIGRALAKGLRTDGHDVVALRRKPGTAAGVPTTVWEPSTSKLPRVAFEKVHAFVNLAGVGIGDGRWSGSHRRAILESRLATTRRLVEAMDDGYARTLVSGSAIGYYGPAMSWLTRRRHRGATFRSPRESASTTPR